MSALLPDEQKTIQTYDKIAPLWTSSYNDYEFWTAEMQKFRQLLPNGTVLEVGAGGARDAKKLVALGYKYVGTDISKKLLEIARKELPDQEFNLQSVYDLSFPDRPKFDGFWASKVLLHISKTRIDEAMQRIKSVIRPGAIGFISLIDGQGEELRTETWDDGSEHSRYFAYYSKAEFTNVAKRNGFKVVDYNFLPETDRLKWHCFFVRTI